MINQDVIRSARKISLAEILLNQDHALLDEGMGFYRDPKMGGLIIKDNYWYQHSTGLKGNTIEYFTLIKKLTFTKALNLILNTNKKPINKIKIQDKIKWTQKINEIKYSKNCDSVEAYLLGRCINQHLLNDMIALNHIKEDNFNNACFIGYDENENQRCISYRAIRSNRKGEFPGSDKEYTFQIKDYERHHKANKTLILAEAPIDILSIATLENIKHQNGFYKTHKIATCGTTSNKLIERIKKLNSNKIYIVMDADQQGQKMATKLEQSLQQIASVKNIILPNDLDPNEYLLSNLPYSS